MSFRKNIRRGGFAACCFEHKNIASLGDVSLVGAYIFASHGIINSNNFTQGAWMQADDGSPATYATDERYKQALKVAQRWYKLEIFDPEIVTDERESFMVKFINNKLAGTFERCDAPFVPTNDWWSFTTRAWAAGNKVEMTIIPPVVGPSGKKQTLSLSISLGATGNIFFGKKTSDEKVIRILQMLQRMRVDEDLMMLLDYGIEGEHWIRTDNGIERTEAVSSAEKQNELGHARFFNRQFITWKEMELAYPKLRYDMLKLGATFDIVPRSIMQVITTDADRSYGAALTKIETEFFWNAVIREIDIDKEWDNYVK